MASVFFDYEPLLRRTLPHEWANVLELRVAGQGCSLWSQESITSVPCVCPSGWSGAARVNPARLLAALRSITEQPVRLELYEEGRSLLYAFGPEPEYETLSFLL